MASPLAKVAVTATTTAASVMPLNASCSRPRTTLEEKIMILDYYHQHAKTQAEAVEAFKHKFSISTSSFGEWVKKEESLRSLYNNSSQILKKSKRRLRFKYDKINREMDKLVELRIKLDKPINEPYLRENWCIFAQKYGVDDPKRLNSFSHGWLSQFKKRHGLDRKSKQLNSLKPLNGPTSSCSVVNTLGNKIANDRSFTTSAPQNTQVKREFELKPCSSEVTNSAHDFKEAEFSKAVTPSVNDIETNKIQDQYYDSLDTKKRLLSPTNDSPKPDQFLGLLLNNMTRMNDELIELNYSTPTSDSNSISDLTIPMLDASDVDIFKASFSNPRSFSTGDINTFEMLDPSYVYNNDTSNNENRSRCELQTDTKELSSISISDFDYLLNRCCSEFFKINQKEFPQSFKSFQELRKTFIIEKNEIEGKRISQFLRKRL